MESLVAMGLPEHDIWSADAPAADRAPEAQPPPVAEAQVEVEFGDWYQDDVPSDDDTAPWCVDDGSGIVVMRTREIYQKVGAGALGLDTKVWRDGRACWLPICECYELTVAPDDEEVPEESGMRRVARHDSMPEPPRVAPPASLRRPERFGPHQLPRRAAAADPARPLLMLLAALLSGILLGLMVYLPFESQARRLDRDLPPADLFQTAVALTRSR
jgi:hypothetical protein